MAIQKSNYDMAAPECGNRRNGLSSSNATRTRKEIKDAKEAKSEAKELSEEIGLLVETSWEVCNKIGGIYAVLSTKARQLKEQFGDSLVFIGPDVWTEENPSPYFKERKNLFDNFSYKTKGLLPWGIKIRTGRWDIPGQPQVILVDPGDTASHIDEIFGQMWEKYGVDSLHAYGDYTESCVFSVASSIVLKALAKHLGVSEKKVLAHYDEWTTGMGLLYTQQTMPEASTVFTTHATSIGRSICGNGKPLYQYFRNYNGDQMAGELNMQSKHSLEKAAAHAADCFTTVSEVTARECEQLLDIRPQVVTPNGFEPQFVPKIAKYGKWRRGSREKILKVASALTGRKYNDNTFIIATSGRHEYRNKGLDVYLDAIGSLNGLATAEQQVIALVLVPGWVKEPSGSLLMNLDFNGTDHSGADFLTHRLNNEDTDEVCVKIRQLERNDRLNNIKVIYVPSYLDGHDGILDIPYYEILPALDMTIFPSYYEPWGYTPLESIAFGVPTITTDKSGFGQWILSNFQNGVNKCGVFVASREDTNYQETVDAITTEALNYMNAPQQTHIQARNAAFITAEHTDWKLFIKNYDDAFSIALRRASGRMANNKR